MEKLKEILWIYCGYLEYFDNSVTLPRMSEDLRVLNKGAKFNGINLEAETLEEQLIYEDDFGDCYIDTFKYVYDCNNEKLYYDEIEDNFFTYNLEDGTMEYLDESESLRAGDERM